MDFSNIKADPSMDQHFLINTNKIHRMIDALSIDDANDIVLELGSGAGTVAEYLPRSCRRLILVELDPALCRHLEEQRAAGVLPPQTEILCADALEVLDNFAAGRNSGAASHLKIISNLPDFLTETVLKQLIPMDFASATIAVPASFDAVRIPAELHPRLLCTLEPEDFLPPQSTASVVYLLTPDQ